MFLSINLPFTVDFDPTIQGPQNGAGVNQNFWKGVHLICPKGENRLNGFFTRFSNLTFKTNFHQLIMDHKN